MCSSIHPPMKNYNIFNSDKFDVNLATVEITLADLMIQACVNAGTVTLEDLHQNASVTHESVASVDRMVSDLARELLFCRKLFGHLPFTIIFPLRNLFRVGSSEVDMTNVVKAFKDDRINDLIIVNESTTTMAIRNTPYHLNKLKELIICE